MLGSDPNKLITQPGFGKVKFSKARLEIVTARSPNGVRSVTISTSEAFRWKKPSGAWKT